MLNLLRKYDGTKKTKVIILTDLEPNEKIISQVFKTKPANYCTKSF